MSLDEPKPIAFYGGTQSQPSFGMGLFGLVLGGLGIAARVLVFTDAQMRSDTRMLFVLPLFSAIACFGIFELWRWANAPGLRRLAKPKGNGAAPWESDPNWTGERVLRSSQHVRAIQLLLLGLGITAGMLWEWPLATDPVDGNRIGLTVALATGGA